jgi:hypothetical protein
MARSKPSPSSAPVPAAGQYLVFHHVYPDIASGKPGMSFRMYRTREAPSIHGAFVHLVTEDGEELWLSGPLTIKPARVV